jgi:hypothetical protein
MVYAYCGEHNIDFSLNKGNLTCEYAGIIAHRKTSKLGLKEPSIEIINAAIKQALCFQSLKRAENITSLSCEKIRLLSVKAEILSGHLTSQNMHVLNNRKIMHDAFSVIKEKDNQDIEIYTPRIAFLNLRDSLEDKQLQKILESEQTKSRNFGMEM